MASEKRIGLPFGSPIARVCKSTGRAMQGIYKIVHTPSGKYYIGSAINIINRFTRHRADLRANKHHCIYLQRLWNKYFEHDFVFGFVEEVADKTLLIQREQSHIDFAVASGLCLNVCLVAGNCLGVRQSPKTRKKRSESMKGIVFTEERKRNISDAKKRQGVSQETIERLKKQSDQQAFKLTFAEAIKIWAKHCGGTPLSKIAKELGVSPKPFRRELRACLGEIYKPIRRSHGNQPKGGLHGMATLSEQDVLTIRASSCSIKSLASKYSVSYCCIYDIVNRRSWKHLP